MFGSNSDRKFPQKQLEDQERHRRITIIFFKEESVRMECD